MRQYCTCTSARDKVVGRRGEEICQVRQYSTCTAAEDTGVLSSLCSAGCQTYRVLLHLQPHLSAVLPPAPPLSRPVSPSV